MLREKFERRRAAWERELVARMRRDEASAYREFLRTFRPTLMDEARRLRVQPALRDEIVDECLDDVALQLRRETTAIPRALAPYLVRALRLHRLKQYRGERRRRDREMEGAASGYDPAAPMAGVISEATRRASAGPDYERTPASPALERLATMLEEGLSDEEQVLFSWVSRWVPQSVIAEWLGVTHGAVRNRVMRLRARLKEATLQHAASFTGRERVEIEDFFRRTFPIGRYGSATGTEGGGMSGLPPRPTGTGGGSDET
jgi:DNA-directed RNA polymerase specialized sigma24 family protein